MEDTVGQIRQVANIIDIASQYTTIHKKGHKFVGFCPFHSEKNPSFTLDEEKQLFHCFGCGAGGDIFTLVMEKENISFPEAVRYLAQKYNITLPRRKKLSPQYLKLEEKLFKINQDALAFFKKNLFNTQEGQKALDYLHQRNIPDQSIQELKIGYALNSWNSLLSYFQEKKVPAKMVEKAGLAVPRQKKDGYYDRFRGRIIFPIFNLTGKVVAFGGRSILDAEPKYLNSPDTPVYNKRKLLYGLNFCKQTIREKGEVILVEGYTDFLSLYAAGITHIGASLGTSLTSDQVSLVKRFAPRMVVSFDADEAGKKAALRAISLCFEKGVQIKVMNLPDDLDPDSYVQKNGTDEFLNLSEKSISGLKYLIETCKQEGNTNIPEEKSKIIRKVMAEVSKIPDSIIRSEYLKQTAEQLSVEEEALRSVIQNKSAATKKTEETILTRAEARLIQILWEDPLICPYISGEMRDSDLQGLSSEPIFHYLMDCSQKKKKPSFHELETNIDPALRPSLAKILMENPSSSPTIDEAKDCLYALREMSLRKESKKLRDTINQLEKKGEQEKLPPLLQRKMEISREISLLWQRNHLSPTQTSDDFK
ncbi:DNA primase [bacterium]|nr:DNA primase [bacterium]